MRMKKNTSALSFYRSAPFFIFLFFSSALFAQNAKNMHHAHPYRGTRTGNTDALFYVTKIESEKEENAYIEIEIKFNIPADPRTLQKHSIFINEKPLMQDCRIVFNKAGNKIKIFIRADKEKKIGMPLQIDLPDAKSFNNIPIYRSRFTDMKIGKEYGFVFSDEYIRFEDD